MKSLADFKDDINKCSKCGLCQSVCPVYKLTGNDCAVSRGKFVMLDGVLKGDLKLNKNIIKYIDLCLKCDKCSNFCPSAIDVCKIFETAKYEYAKNTFWGKLIFFFQSKYVFGKFLNIIKKMHEIPNFISRPIANEGKNPQLTLLYFKGCVNNIFPQADKFLHKLFDNSNVKIIEKDFDCCGLPFLSSGNLKRYEEVKEHNLKLLNCDFDYILTDCASCESTLKSYYNNKKAIPKFISLGELISQQNIKFHFANPIKVTFHKPCHLENDNFFKKIMDNCENVEYIEMNDYDECCGFAGEFAIKNRKISSQLSKQKANNVVATSADYVLTTCPACIIGIKRGLLGIKSAPKVLSLSDFLAKADKIIY